MGLIQVTKENEKYYTKEFVRGFNLGAETQYKIDANEVKRGRWELKYHKLWGRNFPTCTVCGNPFYATRYCPNCGALMEAIEK